jgi:phosphomevalonate kinase
MTSWSTIHTSEWRNTTTTASLYYPQDHGLDFEELLGAGEYKEKYRADMIQWCEKQREKGPGLFCRVAIKAAHQPIWVR